MTKDLGSDKNIHSGHRERIRQRYIRAGISAFSEHEILEFLLFYSVSRVDTNEIAHRLVSRFGSLKAVLNASVKELMTVKGIGENTAVLIKFAGDLSRINYSQKDKRTALDTTEKIGDYLMPCFEDFSVENIVVCALDEQLRPIAYTRITEGSFHNANIPLKKLQSSLYQMRLSALLSPITIPEE